MAHARIRFFFSTRHKSQKEKRNLGKIDEFSLKSISPPNIITFVHMLLIDIKKKILAWSNRHLSEFICIWFIIFIIIALLIVAERSRTSVVDLIDFLENRHGEFAEIELYISDSLYKFMNLSLYICLCINWFCWTFLIKVVICFTNEMRCELDLKP